MDSIENTQRKVSKVCISFEVNGKSAVKKSAVKIIKKFTATIKYFELNHISIEMDDFLEILSLLPNAEHLVFNNVCEEQQTKRQLSNEYLNFHQLKTLELYQCSEKFLLVFNRLPAGVLKKLTLGYWNFNLDLLTSLFTQQSNIKEFILFALFAQEDDDDTDISLPYHIFDHLKLESLECYQHEYNCSYAKILSKQTKLVSLSLHLGKVDDGILNVITNQLSELETLNINLNETLIEPFKNIVKLKKLKDLTLQSCSLKLLETFAVLDNSQITTLNMEEIYTFNNETIDYDDDPPPMPINLIGTLANSVPNLKVLRFGYQCESKIISAIMQNFNFVEVLEMKFDLDIIDVKGLIKAMEDDSCFNPKLTELIICESFHESFLRKLIALYPNLKKLDIHSSSSAPITTSQFKVILNGFKKIESLELTLDYGKLNSEYLDWIENHKNKSITLHFTSSYEFTAEHKKKLSAVFDVISFKFGTLRMSNILKRK